MICDETFSFQIILNCYWYERVYAISEFDYSVMTFSNLKEMIEVTLNSEQAVQLRITNYSVVRNSMKHVSPCELESMMNLYELNIREMSGRVGSEDLGIFALNTACFREPTQIHQRIHFRISFVEKGEVSWDPKSPPAR